MKHLKLFEEYTLKNKQLNFKMDLIVTLARSNPAFFDVVLEEMQLHLYKDPDDAPDDFEVLLDQLYFGSEITKQGFVETIFSFLTKPSFIIECGFSREEINLIKTNQFIK